MEDILLSIHLVKSEGYVLPDVPYFERNLIRNFPEDSGELFLRGIKYCAGHPKKTQTLVFQTVLL